MKNLKNKVVVITGASSGIGHALALNIAAQGAHLVLASRQIGVLTEMAEALKKLTSIRVLPVQTDVSKEVDCARMIEQAQAEFGRIDVLINNAGIAMRAAFQDTELSVLKQLMDVNFWGAVYCTKFALPALLESKGSLVAVSSIAGYRGLPGRTGYSASKFAMNGFIESLRTELLDSGVHVLLACPGYTRSNIRSKALSQDGKEIGTTSLEEEGLMTAEEVADRIIEGIINRSRTLIMTKQGKMAVWINKLAPSLADKLVLRQVNKEKK